jgi:hypothetical protein
MSSNSDHLQRYLDSADEIATEIRQLDPDAYKLLKECVDHIQALSTSKQLNPVSMNLAVNSFFILLSAVRTAISGHPAAVPIGLRTSLESAAYSLLTTENEGLAEVWLKRHKSKEALRLSRRTFSSAVKDAAKVIGRSNSDLEFYVLGLYEAAIDYGAHPNPRAMLGHLSFEDLEEFTQFNFGCLYGWGAKTGAGLIACLDYAIAVIVLLATAAQESPLPDSTCTLINSLMDRKNACADELNGAPIQYQSEIYSQIDPGEKSDVE